MIDDLIKQAEELAEWHEYYATGYDSTDSADKVIHERHIAYAAAIRQLIAKVKEREGWVLVPVEPTLEMLEAAYDAPLGPDRGCVLDWCSAAGMSTAGLRNVTPEGAYDHLMREAYKAMIVASKEKP